MKLTVSNYEVAPILGDLRAVYDLEKQMDRYWAYVNLMTKDRGELLPLGDFSPMGKRQMDFLDHVIGFKAEDYLRSSTALDRTCEPCRIILVVVDEPKNGWTQRYLTDFAQKLVDPRTLVDKNSRDTRWWVPGSL